MISPTFLLFSFFFLSSSPYDCVASCNCFTHVFTFSIIGVFCNAGEIQCEQPNNSLYTFTGNLVIQKQTLPLSPDQLLLRVWLTVSAVGFFFPFRALFFAFMTWLCVLFLFLLWIKLWSTYEISWFLGTLYPLPSNFYWIDFHASSAELYTLKFNNILRLVKSTFSGMQS